MFPKPVYVVAQLVLNVILFALFAFLAWHAVTYLQMSIASAQKSPALGLPMPLCTGGSAGRLHACRRSRPPADRAGNR